MKAFLTKIDKRNKLRESRGLGCPPAGIPVVWSVQFAEPRVVSSTSEEQ